MRLEEVLAIRVLSIRNQADYAAQSSIRSSHVSSPEFPIPRNQSDLSARLKVDSWLRHFPNLKVVLRRRSCRSVFS